MCKLYVVGIGPGNYEMMCIKAKNALLKSEIIVGYKKYIDLIKPNFPTKNFLFTGMTKEIERCKKAIELSKKYIVSIISSGDSGVYGMAGLILQLNTNTKIEIIPGITAANAAASLIGAPLMHDNCCISLSDLLTPIEIIKKRILLAAQADFIITFYNPKSKSRKKYINDALSTILKYRKKQTPVALIKNAYRKEQTVLVTTLEKFSADNVDMNSVVIVGNTQSYIKDNIFITPRGYENKMDFCK